MSSLDVKRSFITCKEIFQRNRSLIYSVILPHYATKLMLMYVGCVCHVRFSLADVGNKGGEWEQMHTCVA